MMSQVTCMLNWQDQVRVKTTEGLIDKLFSMGLIPTKKSLLQCEKIAASAFCRRRLPVVLMRLKLCETLKEAVTFVEQGHIRIGALLDDPRAHTAPTRGRWSFPSSICEISVSISEECSSEWPARAHFFSFCRKSAHRHPMYKTQHALHSTLRTSPLSA